MPFQTLMHRYPVILLLLLTSFALPEIYVHWGYGDWLNEKSLGKMAVFIVLAVLAAGTLSTLAGRLLVVLLWWIQGSQVMHHQFFERFYNGADVALGFVEAHDMAEAMLGMWRQSLPVLLLGAVSLALLIVAMKLARPQRYTRLLLALMVLILLAHGVHHAHKSVWKSEPAFQQLAVHNGLNSQITYWSHFAFRQAVPTEKFAPYQLQPIAGAMQPNIILFIGEGLNPHHMGVLGYDRDTTPQLQQLMQQWPAQKKIIYSAGVTTRVSTPMLLVVNREPKHVARYKTRDGQLVSQAKTAGYHTALYSTQTLDFLPAVSVMSDFDVYVDRAQNKALADDAYVAFLQQQPMQKLPSFTILNIRPPHMPYADHIAANAATYSASKTGDTIVDTRNEYDDAMRTADAIMVASIRTLIERDQRPTLIVISSDHGENMGENGRFGHNRLNLETAEVPLLVIAAHWPAGQAVPDIRCVHNHYQMGVFLLAQMGYQLHNPNQTDNTFYINGNDLYGNNSELAYQVPDCH